MARKDIKMKVKCAWEGVKRQEMRNIMEFAKGYRKFLSIAKTEREAIAEIKKIAEEKGFLPREKVKKVRKGSKIYWINREKCMALAVIGGNVMDGLNIVAAHVDSPRLDLKQKPVYEDKDACVALFKTHYYGGIKKYQWVNIPLAIHGRIIRKDGSVLDIVVGESDDDPVFTITDLLPHLARETQNKRTLPEGVKGEELNVLIGHVPSDDEDEKERVKTRILELLNEKYGIVEEDFVSAEIEVVPAGKARDVGFDKSMIGGYGQDDRICAYTSAMAIMDVKNPIRTCVVFLFDKEEIGSESNTSAQSSFIEDVIADIIDMSVGGGDYLTLRRVFTKSAAISADVNAAVNPNYKDVHELMNAAKIGHGIVITKFTGRGGKYSANDAHAEYVGKIRKLFNDHGIAWQVGELGKVDIGGGGTVAKYLARYNMDIIDCGPSLISMHSPFEITSKVDLYHSYLAYRTFLEKFK
ncbi:MAG: aminopeptidase [Thermoplasmata archaeon]|nr:MAG: aminopeptidase [Thermoplasmata archaeon]